MVGKIRGLGMEVRSLVAWTYALEGCLSGACFRVPEQTRQQHGRHGGAWPLPPDRGLMPSRLLRLGTDGSCSARPAQGFLLGCGGYVGFTAQGLEDSGVHWQPRDARAGGCWAMVAEIGEL